MNKIKRVAAIWALAGGLLLAWFGFAAGVNAGTEDQFSDDVAQMEKVEHFYRVVNGDLSGQEPGPVNKLARDLRELSADRVLDFTGDSNRYGGITSDLGFDPFNGVDCSECGQLDTQIVLDVLAIKEGELDSVLERLESEIDQPSTLAEPPDVLWILWILSLPAGVGFLYVRRRRGEESRYREFLGERTLVHELREAGRDLSDEERWRAAHLADQLEAQIEMRVQYRQSKAQEMKLDGLQKEASDALEAIAAGNKELD